MLQLDPKKRPTIAEIIQNSLFDEVVKGISLFDDNIDLRSFLNQLDKSQLYLAVADGINSDN